MEQAEIERAGRLDVVALLQREDLRADLAHQPGPAEQRQDDRERDEVRRPRERRDHDEDDERRDGEQDVGESDEDRVELAVERRGERAEGHRDERRDAGGEDRDAEDLLSALDEVQHVAAGVVGAEEVGQARGLVDLGDVGLLLRRHEDRRDEREQQEEDDPDEADKAARPPRQEPQELDACLDGPRQRVARARDGDRGHRPVAPPARPIRGSSLV